MGSEEAFGGGGRVLGRNVGEMGCLLYVRVD